MAVALPQPGVGTMVALASLRRNIKASGIHVSYTMIELARPVGTMPRKCRLDHGERWEAYDHRAGGASEYTSVSDRFLSGQHCLRYMFRN